jgi:uncharacterized membrane protein
VPDANRDVDYRNRRGGPAKGASFVLGLAGAGLGAAALKNPEGVSRMVSGRSDATALLAIRAIGARELATAAGLLVRRHPERWMWMRVGGDVIDIALVSLAARASKTDRGRITMTRWVLAAFTAIDVACALRVRRARISGGAAVIRARGSVTVSRPQHDVYMFWRDLEQLPSFMEHLHSVEVQGTRSHWRAKAPAGRTAEWDAEVIEDQADNLIAWRSLRGASVPNRGSVRFAAAPGGRGTTVTVDLAYEPPAGAAGALIAQVFGEEPVQQMQDDLRRFKQIMETGEVARVARS